MTRSNASTSWPAPGTSESNREGRLLAESSRPLLLFETLLPIRFYLPRADVIVDLEPTDTVSYCAYKGRASYFSVPNGPADVAWTYHQPLREAEPVPDHVAFFNERVDIIVEGGRRERPSHAVVRLTALATSRRKNGKLADITGPGITDRWGVTCSDLGASIIAPNGTLVSVFGDTFSGNRVGHGDWRSPVILIGTGDANHPISYQRAGGADPEYAQQLWRYPHRTVKSGRPRRGISTVIPSDLLRVGDTLYLHAIVNRGFGNVVWTEIWQIG